MAATAPKGQRCRREEASKGRAIRPGAADTWQAVLEYPDRDLTLVYSATLANGGANSRRLTPPTMPPMTEAEVASDTANPPSPRFAIGNPSKVVAIADGVPGVFTRIAA